MLKKSFLIILAGVSVFSIGTAFAGLSEIIQIHLQYSNHKGIITRNESILPKGTSDDIWFLFSQAETFLNTDIATLLDRNEKEKILTEYLIDGESLLRGLSYQQNRLSIELQQIENQTRSCQSSLDTANQSFSIYLKNNNENGFYQAVDQAKNARSCLGEQRVLQSAVKNLQSKVNRNIAQIQPRLNYLKNNQELIIKHYDILKPSLLAELYRIAVSLEQDR